MNSLVIYDKRDQIISLITDGKAPATQAAYRRAVNSYINYAQAAGAGFTRADVKAYVQYLLDRDMAPATINQSLTALRQLAQELRYNGVLDRDTSEGILNVQGVEHSGRRLGHWLSAAQVQAIKALPNRSNLKGQREYLVLALLLGCALRRSEAANLTLNQIAQVGDIWIIRDIKGKKNRTRSVPIPLWTMAAIKDWQNAVGVEPGPLLRAVSKAGYASTNGTGISGQTVYNIVKKLAAGIELPDLGPHSLRRTWAREAYKRGYPLDQIKYILGHASIMTTEIYLGLKDLDLDNPVMVEF